MAKRGVIDHPKTKRLARQLGTFPGIALGLLETIWHWVAEFKKDGAITVNDLEDALDSGGWLAMFKAEDVLAAMTNQERECVLLDHLGDGRYYVHDWHDHAEDSIHNWLARATVYFANGTKPSLRRLEKTERERIESHYKTQETDSSAQKAHDVRTASAIALPKPIAKASIPPESPKGESSPSAWVEFLSIYPKRDGALDAADALKKHRKLFEGDQSTTILEGARRYRAWCDHNKVSGTEKVRQIPTWINKQSWLEPWEIRATPSGKPSPFDRKQEILGRTT